jgi:predicted MFS family arabinose efflux permease
VEVTRPDLSGTQRRHNGELQLLIGCAALFTVGNLVGWLTPQMIFGAIHHYGVGAARAGLLPLVEGGLLALMTLLLGARPPKLTHRTLAIGGLGLLILLNGVSRWAPTFNVLLAVRCVAGCADGVCAFAAISLIAMRSSKPDRSYSILTLVLVLVGAGVVAAPPMMFPQFQGLSYLPLMAAFDLVVAPLIVLLPTDARPCRTDTNPDHSKPVPLEPRARLRFTILLAFMVPACVQAFMLFAFSPGLGELVGLSESRINSLLGAATLVSVIGPLAVTPLVKRLGHWRALMAAGLLLLVVNATLATATVQWLFIPSLLFNMILLYFIIPLLLGWSAEFDPSGRCSSIMMGSVTLVTALTPLFAGEVVDHWGLGSLINVVVITGVLYLALLSLMRVVNRKRLGVVSSTHRLRAER